MLRVGMRGPVMAPAHPSSPSVPSTACTRAGGGVGLKHFKMMFGIDIKDLCPGFGVGAGPPQLAKRALQRLHAEWVWRPV